MSDSVSSRVYDWPRPRPSDGAGLPAAGLALNSTRHRAHHESPSPAGAPHRSHSRILASVEAKVFPVFGVSPLAIVRF